MSGVSFLHRKLMSREPFLRQDNVVRSAPRWRRLHLFFSLFFVPLNLLVKPDSRAQ